MRTPFFPGHEHHKADLKPLGIFGFLLTDPQRKSVKEWASSVTSAGQGRSAGAASNARSAPAPEPASKQPHKKRKVSDEAVLRAATKALFRSGK